MLNSKLAFAPFLHMHCDTLLYDSRYTCDQRHTQRLVVSLGVDYANARNAQWEPMLEPSRLDLEMRHNRFETAPHFI
tara:strand:+ start:475 stop:705 length:231 start_codon:yes stop_codon:yes gene_type:complete